MDDFYPEPPADYGPVRPPEPLPMPPELQLRMQKYYFLDWEIRGFERLLVIKSRPTNPWAAGIVGVRFVEKGEINLP
jgi:hypothetical protein